MFKSFTCSLKIQCNENDMNILLHFKQGLIDPSDMISSWFPKLDCCQWKGVKCDNITGRVIELHLPCHINQPQFLDFGDKEDKSNCLTGKFSLTLLELEFLSYLNFSNNDFKSIHYRSMGSHKCDGMSRGNLPHLCGNSTNLLDLDLSYNFDLFFDNLHWLSHLSSLQYLNLGGVRLHKEIDWLQSVTMLPSLVELHLKSCQLENIYPSLHYANFTSLQVLNLAHNSFVSDEFPSWLFNLSCDITHIDLSQNQIHSQLPKTLSNLRNIKSLILSQNYLKGPIPNWLGQLEQLQELDLSYNFFSGPIPASLGNLSSLIELILESNELNGNLPDDLEQLFNLEALSVSENFFTGIVSERNLLSLTNLKHLSMSSPALIFDFDPQWVPLFNFYIFIWVILRYNNLEGKIPHSMGSLSDLRFLNLENNKLFGKSVTVLQLRSNQFSGNIPTQICKLHSLVVMDFARNKLSGPIPSCLCNITAMRSVHTSTLGFKASFPGMPISYQVGIVMVVKGKELMHFTLMKAIDLSSNNLLGSVPLEMYILTGLQSLNLSHNQLMGTIPQEIGNLQQLESIDLSSNLFSGEIPESMVALHYLEVLNLSFNNLVGQIPSGTQLGLTNLSYIGNPNLCGAPLSKICPLDDKFHDIKPMGEEHDEVRLWFYMGLGIGFVVGFWGVFGTILFNRRCRHAYFRFLRQMYDFVIRKKHYIY
ncbi:hypothetical protein Fmac_023655 [Flemingia macrophylla]|uniref:Leucine-rich repeat-containing N-terminal plant-type domain-containing protein n=1 Tax=Flemingia macrophylla TaxID=520843 RepID=A0ABD1LM43_9FABA